MRLEGLRLEHTDPTLRFPAILDSRDLYRRHVEAVNLSIVTDEASLSSKPIGDLV